MKKGQASETTKCHRLNCMSIDYIGVQFECMQMYDRPMNVRMSQLRQSIVCPSVMIAWVKYDGAHAANRIMFNVSWTLDFLIEVKNEKRFFILNKN